VETDEQFNNLPSNDQVEIFINCMFWIGKSSYSHFLMRLEKYLSSFKKVIDTADKGALLLEELSQFWRTSELRQIMLCDKLLTFRIVDHLSIVNWIFAQEKDFTKGYLWQILTNTINKLIDRIKLCESEIEKCADDERKLTLETAHQTATKELRELFLLVFQKFCIVLGNHIHKIENQDYTSVWLHFTLGQLLSFGRKFHKQLHPLLDKLDSFVFNSADAKIKEIFNKFNHHF